MKNWLGQSAKARAAAIGLLALLCLAGRALAHQTIFAALSWQSPGGDTAGYRAFRDGTPLHQGLLAEPRLSDPSYALGLARVYEYLGRVGQLRNVRVTGAFGATGPVAQMFETPHALMPLRGAPGEVITALGNTDLTANIGTGSYAVTKGLKEKEPETCGCGVKP